MDKKEGMKKKGIGFSLALFLFIFNSLLTALPVYPGLIVIPASIILFIILLFAGVIRKPVVEDIIPVSLMLLGTFFVLLVFGITFFYFVPLWVLLVAGVIADVINYVTGLVPVVGDLVGAVIIGVVVYFIIASASGVFVAVVLSVMAALLAAIPGPQLFGLPVPMTTALFLVFKLIVELFGSIF